MAKSKGRLLAELLASDGKVKESKSALDISGGKLAPSDIPVLPNSKLENSSISIAGHSTSLGGSVTLDTGDIGEHTNYKYYTEGRARGAISASSGGGHGSVSYNASTGALSVTGVSTEAIQDVVGAMFSSNTESGITVTYDDADGTIDLSVTALNTGNVTEGSNLYYTDARARAAISATGSLSYNSTTGVMSFTMPAQNTSNITEGSNLYYTNARADARITNALKDEDDMASDSATHIPSQQSVKAYVDAQILTKDNTDEITEGSSNLYFTNARADARITNAGSANWNTAYGWGDHASGGYAPIASPGLTGTPTAPTAAANTNTTQIATTAFVQTELTDLIDGAPGTLDTLNELAAAINDDSNYNSTLTTALATKLPLAGGTLTGTLTVDAGSSGMIDFGDVTTAYGRLYADNSGTFIGSKSNHPLILRSNHTTALTLDTSQNATFAGTISSGAITSSGNVNSSTINSTGQIATGYGLSLTNGNTNFLLYNNTNDNLLYMRDTTNGQFLTTWYTTKFYVNKALDVNGDIQKGGTVVMDGSRNLTNIGTISSGAITSSGNISGSNLNVTSTNWLGWGDYGERIIGSNSSSSLYFYTDATLALTLDGSQNATFAGTINSGAITSSGNIGMVTGHSSGKFAVMASSVHGSYDFYNNGTSYFNGTVAVDANLTLSGGGAILGSPNITAGRVITTGLYGTGHSSSMLPIWQYNAAHHGYGFGYVEGSADSFRFDVSNNLVSGTPDFEISENIARVNGNTVYHVGNDGSGTGLDADLLDGQHGSYYLNASSINAGTINAGRLPDLVFKSQTNNNGGWSQSNRNFSVRSGGDAVGLHMEESDGTFGFQLYSNNGTYGFLDAEWGDWDIQKVANGTFKVDEGSGLKRVLNEANWSSYITIPTTLPANGGNADTVDNLHAASFIRKDAVDSVSSYSNTTQWYSNTNMATASSSQSSLEVFSSGSGNDAFMTFHVGGDYATYFGFDGGTNKLSVGGWSMGAVSHEIYHAGNKPSLATLGYTGATNANYITNNNQLTNGAGYITASGNAATSHAVTGSAFATTSSPSSVLEYQQASGQTDTRLAPSGDWHNTIRMGHGNPYNYYSNTLAARMTGTYGDWYTQTIYNNSPQGWRKIWNTGNDGSGSGLDADLLDGVDSASFLRSDVYDTGVGLALNGGTSNHPHDSTLYVTASNNSDWGITVAAASGKTEYGMQIQMPSSFNYALRILKNGSEHFNVNSSGATISGNYIWHAGNDGSGTGLDADLLDGQHGSYYAPIGNLGNYLPLAGGTMTGDLHLANNVGLTSTTTGEALRVLFPGGAARKNSGSSETGAIKVTLPVGMTNSMLSFKITVYQYNTDDSFEVHVGGYNYPTGLTWAHNPFGYITGSPKANHGPYAIRFGYDSNSKACVYIGETNTTWSYPQIAVTEALVGYAAYTNTTWDDNWDVSIATSFENVTHTIAATDTSTVGWHPYNDGSGSGLDADLFDGVDSPVFFKSPSNVSGWQNSNANFSVRGGQSTSVGLHMEQSNGTFGFQLYGASGTYGFLDGEWAGWDIQKVANGTFKVDEGSGLKRVLNEANWSSYITLPTNADTVDNLHAASFIRSDAADTASGAISFTGGHGAINITSSSIVSSASSTWTGDPGGAGKIQYHSNRWYIVSDSSSNRIVQFRRNGSDKSWIDNDGKFQGTSTNADAVGGVGVGSLLRSDTADTFTGTITMGTQKALVANDYGRGVYGKYSSTVHQHVWSMGTSYNLADNGGSVGNLYGLSYTHTNVGTGYGGNSAAGLGHQLNGRANGTLQWALGDGMWSSVTGSVWGASNDGSGSGLDADYLDGLDLHTGRNNEANKVVRTNASGYIDTGYINTSVGTEALSSDWTKVYASTDNYIRPYGKSDFKVRMGLTAHQYDRMDYTSGTQYHTGANSHNDTTFNGLLQRGCGFIDNWNNSTGRPPTTGGTHWNGFQAMHYASGSSYFHGMQMAMTAGNPSYTYLRGWWANGGSGYGWQKIWTDGNDGSGSGLDADNIRGKAFVNTGSGGGQNADTINNNGISYYTSGVTNFSGNATDGALFSQQYSSSWQHQIAGDYRSGQIALRGKNNGTWQSWRKVWDVSNDGSGSGLDADTLDGSHASSFITKSASNDAPLYIRNGSPTVYLRDTNHNASMLHCNSNVFYVLRGATDATSWAQVGGKWPMELSLSNNDVTFGGNVTAYSDRSLKENIKPIGNSMEMFEQIDAKRFDWIADGKKDIGFIAQDVQAAGLTEVVIEKENKDPETGELLDTKLTLDYSRMVSVLWDVVKEQQEQIDKLNQDMEDLKNKIK